MSDISDESLISASTPISEKIISTALFAVAVLTAAWLRFREIGIKPFHHDEGVNSYFLLNLAHTWQYKYDPANYHGPTLYYFAVTAVKVFGETDFALRFWPAVFGVMTVLMIWLIRRHLGLVGTVIAAFCLALSPGLVYFSRDFIHEMSFGCFSFGIVIGAWRYAESKKFAYLALAAVCTGLLFATKETAIVTIIVMVIAAAGAAILDIMRRLLKANQFSPAALVTQFRRDLSSIMPSLDHSLAALIIFIFINIFFYSSLFSHWSGVVDAVKSVVMWTGRRNNEHVKGFSYYLGILVKLELPILIGSLLAGAVVLWRGTSFWLFVAAWALGITLAYSLIGYKTPWLMISFIIPMAILSGYAAEQIYRALPMMSAKLLWMTIVGVVLILCAQLTWQINFQKYDDNTNGSGYFTKLGQSLNLKPYVDGQYGYVYAQTDRDIFGLMQAIKLKTEKLGSGPHTGIYIGSPDYWPLPWYLRDYDQVAFSGRLPVATNGPPSISQPLVIIEAPQQGEMQNIPGWQPGSGQFALRPGVNLMLYEKQN